MPDLHPSNEKPSHPILVKEQETASSFADFVADIVPTELLSLVRTIREARGIVDVEAALSRFEEVDALMEDLVDGWFLYQDTLRGLLSDSRLKLIRRATNSHGQGTQRYRLFRRNQEGTAHGAALGIVESLTDVIKEAAIKAGDASEDSEATTGTNWKAPGWLFELYDSFYPGTRALPGFSRHDIGMETLPWFEAFYNRLGGSIVSLRGGEGALKPADGYEEGLQLLQEGLAMELDWTIDWIKRDALIDTPERISAALAVRADELLTAIDGAVPSNNEADGGQSGIKGPSMAEELGVSHWSDFVITVSGEGLRFKKTGASGCGRFVSWKDFGYRREDNLGRVLIESIANGLEGLTNRRQHKAPSKYYSQVSRVNEKFREATGMETNPLKNSDKRLVCHPKMRMFEKPMKESRVSNRDMDDESFRPWERANRTYYNDGDEDDSIS